MREGWRVRGALPLLLRRARFAGRMLLVEQRQRKGETILNIELAENMGQVKLDGFFRDPQVATNLFVSGAILNQSSDFTLTAAQRGEVCAGAPENVMFRRLRR